jgi:hypothetical protein
LLAATRRASVQVACQEGRQGNSNGVPDID